MKLSSILTLRAPNRWPPTLITPTNCASPSDTIVFPSISLDGRLSSMTSPPFRPSFTTRRSGPRPPRTTTLWERIDLEMVLETISIRSSGFAAE